VSPATVNADPQLLARLESIRAAAAVVLGFVPDEPSAITRSAALPRLVLVDAPRTHRLANGRVLEGDDHDIIVRATSMQRAHHACPLTTAMCVAAATKVPDSVASAVVAAELGATVRIAHPKGLLDVGVRAQECDGQVEIRSASVARTARRLLEGTAHVIARTEAR
jgi:2-methylaconitate cis-trans-isomerase PrpF